MKKGKITSSTLCNGNAESKSHSLDCKKTKTPAEKIILSLSDAEIIIPAKYASKTGQEALKEAAKKHGVKFYLKLTPYGVTAGLQPPEYREDGNY